MEKYEFIFSIEPIFENDEASFKFENIEIKIYKKEEYGVQVINEIGVVVESENEFLAEESVYLIIEKLNNFFNFKKGCFLIKEPFEYKTRKNLSTSRQTVAKKLTLSWSIRNKLSFADLLKDYENYKVMERLIGLYGDAERVHDRELKFLAYYKVIEFENKDVDRWLKKKGEKRTFVSSRSGNSKDTEFTKIRHDICHPRSRGRINISKEYLNKIKKYSRQYIEEKLTKC